MPLLNQVPDGHLNFPARASAAAATCNLFLVGDDPALVERAGHQVLEEMRGLPELRDAAHQAAICRGRRSWCIRGSTSPRSSASACRASARPSASRRSGDLPQNGAKFSLSDRQIPIRVSLLESVAARPDHARESAGAHRVGRQRAAEDPWPT